MRSLVLFATLLGLFALLLVACGHEGLGSSSDMAGVSCAAVGASCVAHGVDGTCPGGGQRIDSQEAYCGGEPMACCLSPCPATPEAALGQPCTGPRVCDYVDECSQAVCQVTNGNYSWYVYTRNCP
ncbi:MAG: hypothetical protein ABI321_24030 [Polyangia bacterium]